MRNARVEVKDPPRDIMVYILGEEYVLIAPPPGDNPPSFLICCGVPSINTVVNSRPGTDIACGVSDMSCGVSDIVEATCLALLRPPANSIRPKAHHRALQISTKSESFTENTHGAYIQHLCFYEALSAAVTSSGAGHQ
jgi:hypothetical protein